MRMLRILVQTKFRCSERSVLSCSTVAYAVGICNLVSIKSCSDYFLRSNKSLFLDRPKGRMLSTLGACSFYAAAPTL